MRPPEESVLLAHREVLRLMQTRDWPAAEAACLALTDRHPRFAAGWFAASRIALMRNAAAAALAAIDKAVGLEAKNPAYHLHRGQCLLALMRRADALDAAATAEACAPLEASVLDAAGTLLSYARDQKGALAAYERAVSLAPRAARFRYNRASVRRFLGDLDGAESDYDEVIALEPQDAEAYYNRTELRVQTSTRNHVVQLEARAAESFADWRAEVQIRYALAKEYEDLGLYAQSFMQLKRGADRRRAHMNYEVARDVATVDWIIDAFARTPEASKASSSGAPVAAAPIFIVGLPRSGTTLAERILASHSGIVSAGELDAFATALVGAARSRAGRDMSRRELVAFSATLDFSAVAARYLTLARGAVDGEGRIIDKMPLNYLYCGLIRRALPDATIIHMTRHPMAVCYAMYKTLFKDGYPFSYDLTDIARYYIAYRRLMDHWQGSMPGVLYELSYERLVGDQMGETRKLLAHCGLPWEEACAAFHQNPQATTTASAAQVRRPLYNSSVAIWRHYTAELAPLSAALTSAGIPL